MKNLLIPSLLAAFLELSTAFAGEDAGNGGGAWVCQNKDQLKTIRWAKLVDLYEAEKEFSIPMDKFIDYNKDHMDIYRNVKKRLLWVQGRDIYKKIEPYFDEVENKFQEVNVDLEIIEDSLYRVRPPNRDCVNGDIKYVQLANYTDYGVILINQYLFNSDKISNVDKGALIVHEAIYAYLRKVDGDVNSIRARRITGVLFSALPIGEMNLRINTILAQTSHQKENNTKIKISRNEHSINYIRCESFNVFKQIKQQAVLRKLDFGNSRSNIYELIVADKCGEEIYKHDLDLSFGFGLLTKKLYGDKRLSVKIEEEGKCNIVVDGAFEFKGKVSSVGRSRGDLHSEIIGKYRPPYIFHNRCN